MSLEVVASELLRWVVEHGPAGQAASALESEGIILEVPASAVSTTVSTRVSAMRSMREAILSARRHARKAPHHFEIEGVDEKMKRVRRY